MSKKIEFLAGQSRIAYVRPVAFADLPQDMQIQANSSQDLYAVHSENGDRLALVNGRKFAFFLARQNDLAPVNVH